MRFWSAVENDVVEGTSWAVARIPVLFRANFVYQARLDMARVPQTFLPKVETYLRLVTLRS